MLCRFHTLIYLSYRILSHPYPPSLSLLSPPSLLAARQHSCLSHPRPSSSPPKTASCYRLPSLSPLLPLPTHARTRARTQDRDRRAGDRNRISVWREVVCIYVSSMVTATASGRVHLRVKYVGVRDQCVPWQRHRVRASPAGWSCAGWASARGT